MVQVLQDELRSKESQLQRVEAELEMKDQQLQQLSSEIQRMRAEFHQVEAQLEDARGESMTKSACHSTGSRENGPLAVACVAQHVCENIEISNVVGSVLYEPLSSHCIAEAYPGLWASRRHQVENEHNVTEPLHIVNGQCRTDLWHASTYHDEYTRSNCGSSYIRYWFVCLAGGTEYPCLTAITSKLWGRRKPLGAPKNKWFCTYCNSNYKTKFGCLIEVRIVDQLYYLRSRIPDGDALDIKACEIEDAFRGRELDAQELLDSIPVYEPTTTSLVEPRNVEKGQFKITDYEYFRKLPEWEWMQIVTFGRS